MGDNRSIRYGGTGDARAVARRRQAAGFALAPLRSLALAGLAIVEGFAILAVGVATVLACIGIGIPLVAPAVLGVRGLANLSRRLAGRWSRTRIPALYAPEPRDAGLWHRWQWLFTDAATWRDFVWALVDPIVGGALALVSPALILWVLSGWCFPSCGGRWSTRTQTPGMP